MWQAMRWPATGSCTGGASVSQTAPSLRGQRVLNTQPLGGLVTDGRLPSRMMRVFSTEVSAIGTADSSARSEEHTSELQSLMRISYAVFCLKKKQKKQR